MPKLSELRSDEAKEREGVWIKWRSGIELKIARANQPRYLAEVRELGKKHRIEIRHGSLEQEQVLELLKPLVARHLLLDWRNVDDDDGKPLPYTPEEGIKAFEDPQLRDFYMFVTEVAGDAALFAKELVEEDAKN